MPVAFRILHCNYSSCRCLVEILIFLYRHAIVRNSRNQDFVFTMYHSNDVPEGQLGFSMIQVWFVFICFDNVYCKY